MSTVATLRAYKSLEEKIGAEIASEVIDIIENEVRELRKKDKEQLSTKDDIHRLELLIERTIANQTRWIIGLLVTIAGLLLANLIFK